MLHLIIAKEWAEGRDKLPISIVFSSPLLFGQYVSILSSSRFRRECFDLAVMTGDLEFINLVCAHYTSKNLGAIFVARETFPSSKETCTIGVRNGH